MSDAAVDVFADAFVARVSRVFEDDPITPAVAAAMAKLAAEVRGLPTWLVPTGVYVDLANVLALIEEATP